MEEFVLIENGKLKVENDKSLRLGPSFFLILSSQFFEGGLAQLARASALHAEGQRFESVILHSL